MHTTITFALSTVALVLSFSVSNTFFEISGVSDPQPFMDVRSIEHKDGMVIADRKINGNDTFADWRVVIVSSEGKAPSCATVPGPLLHQGWSDYTANDPTIAEMTLDDWVNDPGCYERIKSAPGLYNEYITWTPRDGRDPVPYIGEIVIE